MKRLFSMMLVLCLAFSLCPSAALAAESATHTVLDGTDCYSAVIKQDGSLWVWGAPPQYGPANFAFLTGCRVPTRILDGVSSVSCGPFAVAALKNDGALWLYGDGESIVKDWQIHAEQNTEPYRTPVKLMDGVIAVSLGMYHIAAIKEDYSLWLWGSNEFGQIGNGYTDDGSTTPQKIMEDVVSVCCGQLYTMALKKDGTLWAWGSNHSGLIGNGGQGNAVDSFTGWQLQTEPQKIMEDVIAICNAGSGPNSDAAAAFKRDGSLWVWGGPLHTPEQIMNDVVCASVSGVAAAAIKSDDSLWTWNIKKPDESGADYYYNAYGQLGNGSTDPCYTPSRIMDHVDAVSMKGIPCAIQKDGSVWAWGPSRVYEDDGWYELAQTVPVKIMDGAKLASTFDSPDPTGASAVSAIFSDVDAGVWYEKYLQAAYDSGIIGGMPDGTYAPSGNLTHAQIMVMAANLHSKQKGDDFKASAVSDDHWAAAFRDYCKAEGIIDDRFDNSLDELVNRSEMAYYFANTLTASSYKVKQSIEFKDIAGNDYEAEINKLAKADIVGGKGEGKYDPAALVTRAEAAVFISNILDAIGE